MIIERQQVPWEGLKNEKGSHDIFSVYTLQLYKLAYLCWLWNINHVRTTKSSWKSLYLTDLVNNGDIPKICENRCEHLIHNSIAVPNVPESPKQTLKCHFCIFVVVVNFRIFEEKLSSALKHWGTWVFATLFHSVSDIRILPHGSSSCLNWGKGALDFQCICQGACLKRAFCDGTIHISVPSRE